MRTLTLLLALMLGPVAAMAADEPVAPGSYAYLKDPPATGGCKGVQEGSVLKVSIFSENGDACPVAKVGDEVITLGQLTAALARAHEGRGADQQATRTDPSALMRRMIEVRLLVLEARDMGLPEEPEVVAAVRGARAAQVLSAVQVHAIAGAKPDPAEIDRLYKDAVREWQLRSVLFYREGDAKAFAKSARGGRFESAAKKAIAEKKGRGGDAGGFVGASSLVPPVAAAVRKMKVGDVSAPVKLQEGFAVITVEAVRYPVNAAARAEAEGKALGTARQKALKDYYQALLKAHVKYNNNVLASVDFNAKKPGIEALKKDKRPVVTIDGTEVITVGDLATAVERQYFHGVDRAAASKKANKLKDQSLDVLVSERVIPAEAKRLGLDATPEFQSRLAESTEGILFGTMMRRVVEPEIRLSQDTVKKYYEEHKANYMFPAFYKLQGIAFAQQKDAEAALKKLKGGTDWKWLNANADGVLHPGDATENFTGGTLSEKALPEALRKALAGAKTGDDRLYAGANNQFYVLHVVEYVPPKPQPFEDVADPIARQLHDEAVLKVLRDYAGKIEKAHPVHVYLTRIGS